MDLMNIMADSLLCDPQKGLLPVFGVIGNVVTFIKIAVPIIIIIMGSIDLMKAVMASKDDEIKKAQGILIKRAIYGVVIFFIPTIVTLLMNLVNQDNQDVRCMSCITTPSQSQCQVK